jgi:hypothetical protein
MRSSALLRSCPVFYRAKSFIHISLLNSAASRCFAQRVNKTVLRFTELDYHPSIFIDAYDHFRAVHVGSMHPPVEGGPWRAHSLDFGDVV